ncbi:hypothetical protein HYDPIDRAFT_110605 [Hydnomerulius pinastri MD-312]|nr:hypothetical protein HYDPIDRAFT_110605 [Hydnomerulius pinastri MD-312]
MATGWASVPPVHHFIPAAPPTLLEAPDHTTLLPTHTTLLPTHTTSLGNASSSS